MIQFLTIVNYDGLSNFTLYGEAPVGADAFGCKWGLFDIKGWNDSAEVRPAIYERPFHDGAVLESFSYAARTLEIHGGMYAPDRKAGLDAMRRLKGAFEVRDFNYGQVLRRLYIQEFWFTADYGYILDVRRQAAIEVIPSQYGRAYEFVVPVIAPDPRKYSFVPQDWSLGAGGAGEVALNLTAVGNMPLFVNFMQIMGPVTNPRVTHNRTGQFLQFTGTIPAGQYIYVDMKTHAISGYLNRSNLDAASQFFPLLPGANQYKLTGAGINNQTTLRVQWNDAWE